MLIGVVSDTHNNLKNIDQIISLFNDKEIQLVIHTGDIANAKSFDKFSKLNANLIGVYGNNDRNEAGLEDVAIKNNFQFQEPPKLLTLFNRKIAIFHEPDPIDEFLKLIEILILFYMVILIDIEMRSKRIFCFLIRVNLQECKQARMLSV